MPAKTILTLLFLISLGVIAIVSLHALPQRVNADTVGAGSEILVAAATLPAGTLLRAKDLNWQPANRPEPDQIFRAAGGLGNTTLEIDQQLRTEVYGAALRIGLATGESIRRDGIVKPGDRDFLQVVLSPGARAIAIPVTTGGASTGLLYPGDRVDVVLTQSFKNDSLLARRSVSETVVQSLRVLAVDAIDPKLTGAGNGFGRTVTLEVTQEQAEKINVAVELGKLSLTLRSIITADASGAAFSPASSRTAGVRSTWAGDVSPALIDAARPDRAVTAERPSVEVIRGSKSAAVKQP
jgi:pilus assembly protein CpaB